MKELRNDVDHEANFENLEEAKNYYMPNLEECPECMEYAEEIQEAKSLEDLAEVLNRYTDRFEDGRFHNVVEF